MKKKLLILAICLSLFIVRVNAEEVETPDEQILISENVTTEEEQVAATPQEEEEEETQESSLENEGKKENYLGPIILVFLVLLFLMFSFRNQAKNSKDIIKR